MGLVMGGLRFVALFPLSVIDNLFASKKSQINSVGGLDKIKAQSPILIYVHFSKDNSLTVSEIQILEILNKIGLSVCVVFNEYAKNKSDSPLVAELQESPFTRITRHNIGYDLGAYRDVFNYLDANGFVSGRKIYFMNNSVRWFPKMIEKYFSNIANLESDIFAASISDQYTKHLQTFLFGSISDKGHNGMRVWLNSIKNWKMKKTIVRCGELRTSNLFGHDISVQDFPSRDSLQDLSFEKIMSLVDSDQEMERNSTLKRLIRNRDFALAGLPINPSHSLWAEMLEKGFPGVKLDLIRSNSTDIPDYDVMLATLLELGMKTREINELLHSNKNKSLVFRIRTLIRW